MLILAVRLRIEMIKIRFSEAIKYFHMRFQTHLMTDLVSERPETVARRCSVKKCVLRNFAKFPESLF